MVIANNLSSSYIIVFVGVGVDTLTGRRAFYLTVSGIEPHVLRRNFCGVLDFLY